MSIGSLLVRRSVLQPEFVNRAPVPDEVVDAGVPMDGGVFVPTTAAHWSTLGLPVPLVQSDCGVASGDLSALIGSDALVAQGSGLLYQQAVSGWSGPFVGTSGGAAQGFRSSSSTFAIALNQAFAWLVYMQANTPAATLAFLTQGNANWNALLLSSTGRLRTTFDGSGASDGTGPTHSGSSVRPYIFYRKSSSSTVMGVLTDARNFAPAVSSANDAIANTQAGIGPLAGNALVTRTRLCAFWKGTDADLVSQRSTLVALNWSPTW